MHARQQLRHQEWRETDDVAKDQEDAIDRYWDVHRSRTNEKVTLTMGPVPFMDLVPVMHERQRPKASPIKRIDSSPQACHAGHDRQHKRRTLALQDGPLLPSLQVSPIANPDERLQQISPEQKSSDKRRRRADMEIERAKRRRWRHRRRKERRMLHEPGRQDTPEPLSGLSSADAARAVFRARDGFPALEIRKYSMGGLF